MAQPNSLYNELASVTINEMSDEAADSVIQHNAALRMISESGNVKTVSGGVLITETIRFAQNVNGGSFSGYDILPTAAADELTLATYSLKQYAVPVVFSSLEQAQNSGKQQIIDLVEERVEIAQDTMKNLLNQDIYGDGTSNNGKVLTGLGAAVVYNGTNVYGGIDRSVSTNAFWKNQSYQATADGGGVATSSTIQSQWNTFIKSMTFGPQRPNVILCDSNVHGIFEGSLQAIQRITDADSASAGFLTVEYKGIPVIFDTTASNIPANTAYFLNTKFLKWRPHKDFNMISLDDKQSLNQAATVKTLVWYGNMTTSGSRYQGIYVNE